MIPVKKTVLSLTEREKCGMILPLQNTLCEIFIDIKRR